MNLLTRYRNVIIVVVLIVLGFILYSVFLKPSGQAVLTTTTVSSTDDPVDSELIALLLTLHGITLNTALFDDPKFKSLKDFGRDLVAEPVGRPNPFAPL